MGWTPPFRTVRNSWYVTRLNWQFSALTPVNQPGQRPLSLHFASFDFGPAERQLRVDHLFLLSPLRRSPSVLYQCTKEPARLLKHWQSGGVVSLPGPHSRELQAGHCQVALHASIVRILLCQPPDDRQILFILRLGQLVLPLQYAAQSAMGQSQLALRAHIARKLLCQPTTDREKLFKLRLRF